MIYNIYLSILKKHLESRRSKTLERKLHRKKCLIGTAGGRKRKLVLENLKATRKKLAFIDILDIYRNFIYIRIIVRYIG